MQQPTLFLMVGYPGSGKTTAARIICELTGAEHIWADRERDKMFQNPTHGQEESAKLYSVLDKKVRQLLSQGKNVVYDSNFNFRKNRDSLRQLATRENAKTTVVWITTSKNLARQRAAQESEGGETRIWGNMPLDEFERLARNLQPPLESENPLKLEGISLTKETLAKALKEHRHNEKDIKKDETTTKKAT